MLIWRAHAYLLDAYTCSPLIERVELPQREGIIPVISSL